MVVITDNKKENLEFIGNNKVGINYSLPQTAKIGVNSGEGYLHKFSNSFNSSRLKEAKELLKLAHTSRTLIQAGDVYLLYGNYKRAIRYYLEALKKNPNHIPIYEKIILGYSRHKIAWPKAFDYYQKLLELNNRKVETLHDYAMYRAMMFTGNNGLEDSINLFNEALKKEKDNFAVLNSYGFVLMNFKNDFKKAKECFEHSIQINPEYVHPINNLGVIYQKEGKLKEASAYFKKAVEIVPLYIDGYQNLAFVYFIQNQYKNALDILTEAKKRNLVLSRDWEHKIGWLLIKIGNSEEAIKWYESKIKEEPNNGLLYNNLGIAFKQLGKLDEAERSFNETVRRFKLDLKFKRSVSVENMKALYNLGRLASDKRDYEKLREVVDEIRSINKNDPYGLYFSGVIFSVGKRYDKAKEVFKEVLEINDKVQDVYADYSFILECIDKDYIGAIKILEKAISYSFNSPFIENNLAYAYINNGDLDKAEAIINNYDLVKTRGMLLATKGLLEFRKDKLKEGNYYYERAVKDISGEDSNIAKQIWGYEKASYWFRKKEFTKAKKEIELLKESPESYMTLEISNLAKKLNQILGI